MCGFRTEEGRLKIQQHKALIAGGDTLMPVDLVSMANQLEWKGWSTVSEVLDAACVELAKELWCVSIPVKSAAFLAIIGLIRIMGCTDYDKGNPIPQDILKRAIKVAADILPQE